MQQPCTGLPNLDKLNQFSVSVGPTQTANLNASHQPPKMNRIRNTIVLQQTDTQQVAKILKELKNKKAFVLMELKKKH